MTEDDDNLIGKLIWLTNNLPEKKQARTPSAKKSPAKPADQIRFSSPDNVAGEAANTKTSAPTEPTEQAELIQLLKQLLDAHNRQPTKRGNNQPATAIAADYIKKTGAKISLSIIRDIDEAYDKAGLQLWVPYARAVIKKHRPVLDSLALNLPYELLGESGSGPANKGLLVWALAFVLADQAVYRLFMEELPLDVQRAAEQLVWFPSIGAEALGQLIGTIMTVRAKQTPYYYNDVLELASLYKLLPHTGGNWNGPIKLSWPKAIRTFLQTVYSPPADFQLHPVRELPAGLLCWDEGELIVFEEMQKLLAYRMQDAITVNVSGKVSGMVPKKMRKTLGVREFYPDSGLFPAVRTALLAQILTSVSLKEKQVMALDVMAILGQLRKTLDKPFKLLFLLNELKEHGRVEWASYKQEAETALVDWMGRLPVGEWVSAQNILNYAQYHDLLAMPCSLGYYGQLQYEGESMYSRGSLSRRPVVDSDKGAFVAKPALLGGFFLFAALGWLDIAYVEPTGTFGKDYFSAYDGLRYVRLNPLGASIFGRSQQPYVPKVNAATQALRFDDQSLLIFCDPDNKVAETVLANYAERVSPTRFRVTAGTFLKECKSRSQLQTKITLFTKSVAPDLPPNWAAFFNELLGKAEPLQPAPDLTIFRIAATNQSLIRLLAQDPVLQTMVIKAEGFRILVANSQLTTFKNRLRELGYLV